MIRRMLLICTVTATLGYGVTLDSVFEPLIRPFDLLPEYYMRLDLSTFAFHRDAFFKRQYLAEVHPDLEFCLLSYKGLIASVWQADFQFGLGEVPGNVVFTVLNVSFGYNPTIEVRLRDLIVSVGMPHRCFHEVDRTEFPVAYYNKAQLKAASPNASLDTYWRALTGRGASFAMRDRFSWRIDCGYYIKELFGLADPAKLNGNNPNVWDLGAACRFALYRRQSWIVAARGESTVGRFDRSEGYHVSSRSGWYWQQTVGVEVFFTRGRRGASVQALYHLDDLPVAAQSPAFTLGNSRFSRNGLAQIGVTFFN